MRTSSVPSVTFDAGLLIECSYFGLFEGGARCGIQADDLYIPPQNLRYAGSAGNEYCHNRAQLLQAMSHGGRYGFDAPYKAKGE